MRDDAVVVELATLTAMVSLFATSLGTLQQRVAEHLVTSNAVALSQSVAQGSKVEIATAATRASYAKAPYRLPALRYVYSLGWVSGTRHGIACVLARLDVAGTRTEVIDALRKSPQALQVIRRLRLSLQQTGTAFTAGFTAACA